MDTAPDLFTQLCSFENLYLAYRKARKGKRAKPGVASFEFDQEAELLRLQDELLSERWQPGPYNSFFIHDPKRRLISAAPFHDRVVHHALCNQIEPLWERRFIFDSYANRVGKGTHRALDRCQEFSRRFPYVLQCDLEQYFPSIDHAILLEILARHIPEPRVMALVERILASGAGVLDAVYQPRWFPGDDLWSGLRQRGLPIGNLTSRFWANVYLNSFDHFVKRELRCPAYLRYVDDFLLFAEDKRTQWGWKIAIEKRLAGLRLSMHTPQVFPVETGIPFLGFRVYPDHRRLKKRKGIAFQRRFKTLYLRWLAGELPRQRLDATVRSWAAHAASGDTYGLRRAVLGRFVLGSV